MSNQSGGWDTAIETQDYTPSSGTAPHSGGAAPYGGGAAPQKGASILVDQSESIVSTIGSNYLQNFLSGGQVSKGVGILTQKRFYYKGRNFSGSGKDMKVTTEEGVVSIEDITFSNFSYTRNIGALVGGLLLAIIGSFCVLWLAGYGGGGDVVGFGGLVMIGVAVFLLVKFFVTRKSLFVVSFPGGSFGFDIRYYPISDIRDFQRQLHLLKDHRKEGGNA